MREKNLPAIGITCGTDNNLPKGRELYARAVKRANGSAVFLSPDADVGDCAARYAGFIIPGGRDIHPSCYNEELTQKTVPEEQARTDFEFSILRAVIDLEKPVLGICYGMQLINVFFKGDLYQDCSSQIPESYDHTGAYHIVQIRDNPFIDVCECEVDSSHHQAVRKGGAGLRPFANTHDGIVEALFLEGHRFLVGVQWHPERMNGPLTTRLFARFVEACRAKR